MDKEFIWLLMLLGLMVIAGGVYLLTSAAGLNAIIGGLLALVGFVVLIIAFLGHKK